MKKTYVEECLERANQATPGPWKNDCGNGQIETEDWRVIICDRAGNRARKEDVIEMFPHFNETDYPEISTLLGYDNEDDMDFIAHARQDVPELCQRLELVRAWLYRNRDKVEWVPYDLQPDYILEQLEAPLEGSEK